MEWVSASTFTQILQIELEVTRLVWQAALWADPSCCPKWGILRLLRIVAEGPPEGLRDLGLNLCSAFLRDLSNEAQTVGACRWTHVDAWEIVQGPIADLPPPGF